MPYMFKYFLEVTVLVNTQGVKTTLSFSSLIKAKLDISPDLYVSLKLHY